MSRKQSAAGVGIRIAGLAKTYGSFSAVDDMNLAVNPGEFVSFLGPSGSGKTTTLMMMAGFVAPTQGEIFIGDEPVARLPAQKRGLGMVFQNYALFPHMTVAENVAFPLKMRRLGADEIGRRVREALDMVKLGGFDDRYPRQLSGGQQQRVALARAIVFKPKALLMDEPLGALDKKLREHMQLEIKRIQASLGVTVIYVTHDQEEALTMSDRIVVMRDGRIEQVGGPSDLYEDPRTAFVADFIGESNLIDGTILNGRDGTYSVALGEGRTVSAPHAGDLPEGAGIRLCVRPERVQVTPVNEGPQAGTLSGIVEDVIYVGDATKLRIRCPSCSVTAKLPNTDPLRRHRTGEPVNVSWAPSSAKILAE